MFIATALNPENKIFVIHIALLSSTLLTNSDVYLSRKFQITSLIAKEISTKMVAQYANFTDIFFPNLASKLSKYIEINDQVIELINY